MKTIASALGVAALTLSLVAAHAEGEMGHCHNRGPGGQLVAADDLDTRQACDEEGGIWFRQPQHCHTLGTDGKVTELTAVKNQKACVVKGGQWMDHSQASSLNKR